MGELRSSLRGSYPVSQSPYPSDLADTRSSSRSSSSTASRRMYTSTNRRASDTPATMTMLQREYPLADAPARSLANRKETRSASARPVLGREHQRDSGSESNAAPRLGYGDKTCVAIASEQMNGLQKAASGKCDKCDGPH